MGRALLLAMAWTLACGGAATAPSTEPSTPPPALVEEAPPETLVDVAVTPPPVELASLVRPEPVGMTAWTSVFRIPPAEAPSGAKADVRGVFRRVAPSTPIVGTGPESFGSGVLIDRDFVLTNDHVISHAPSVDFLQTVDVVFGELTRNGTVRPMAPIQGQVVARAPESDLALVRLLRPAPAQATPVTLSEDPPLPGEPVAALGHGSIGLAWGIRSCEVQAVGRSAQAGPSGAWSCAGHPNCQVMTTGPDPMMLQSSCEIAPGDSGGPIVNERSELVGLNVLIRFAARPPLGQDRAPVATYFHVHLDEIRAFLASATREARPAVPSAFGPASSVLPADSDGDGVIETLVVTRGDETVTLLDLDGDTRGLTVSTAPQIYRDGRFDAELVVLRHPASAVSTYLYDRDADGRLETVLRYQGRVLSVHTVDAQGVPQRDDSVLEPRADWLRPSWLPRNRSQRPTELLPRGPRDVVGPLPAALRAGRRYDGDEDGVADLLFGQDPVLRSFAFDADQRELDAVASTSLSDAVGRGAAGLEAVLIESLAERRLWGWYDRDADGTFETLAHADSHGVIDHVTLREGDAPELLGSLIGQPSLTRAPNRARMLFSKVRFPVGATSYAGWPDPLLPEEGPSAAWVDLAGLDDAVMRLRAGVWQTVLVDVDRDSFTGRNRARRNAAPDSVVADGHFDAELAVVMVGPHTWAFYDTDGDRSWDRGHVLLVRPGRGEELVARSFDAQGRATVVEGRGLIQPDVFRNGRVRTALARVAPLLFAESAIAP